MISQNRLRLLAMKTDFTASKYKDALKYYGYSSENFLNNGSVIYPIPVIKNSRTLTKQASLPKMPVPQLESSMDKYLTAVKPLLNENEFENTKKIASEFIKSGGLGEKLQRMLVEKSKTTENWLSQWWLDKVYLEPRYSVVINVNPATLYPHVDYKTLDEQLTFATKYICGFLDFKKFLEDQKLPTEKLGDSYLCMDQYFKLFGTCRIPNKEKDLIKVMQVFNIDNQQTNHITVMHNNRIFSLQIIDPKSGNSINPNEILKNLKKIVEMSNEENENGLGILTSENRDIWSNNYNKLSQNEHNKKSFESIHNSLFVLCLDTKDYTDNSLDTRSAASGQILHGNKLFTSNRWFDKTIQVIIGANGVWGTNFEHSIAEAVPHSLMNDYIYKYIQNEKIDFENSEQNIDNYLFQELNFIIPRDVKNQISKSKLEIYKSIDNLDLYILNFDAFGKNFPKSQKLSPDAFVQVAMQLAFYRAHKIIGNAYESGSLRKYSLGRTEIIRACTLDAAKFVKAMSNDGSNIKNEDKTDLFLKAINSHRLYTVNVLNCESFDRHLLGLKLIALENGFELPDIYKDVAFRKACHYYISSSQVSSKYEAVTSYGPAVEDGYGACYNITEKKILFGLSSYKSCQSTNSKMFAECIQNALLDCQNLLIKFKSKL